MIQKGHWFGYYTFDNPAHNKARGFEKTNFDVEILRVENNSFMGKVQDDFSTGGTEGTGDIIGKVTGDNVAFVKQMPVMTILVDKKGTSKTFNRKHKNIFYSGKFSEDRKTISGIWRFKFGFIFLGILPVPIIPAKGKWMMTLKD